MKVEIPVGHHGGRSGDAEHALKRREAREVDVIVVVVVKDRAVRRQDTSRSSQASRELSVVFKVDISVVVDIATPKEP